MSCIGRCGIYATRPGFCRSYPTPTSTLPEGCTFSFLGSERQGECRPDVCQENNCCNYPREGGEPEGKALDPLIGGVPCKHLVWVETGEEEKVADNEAESITGDIYEALEPSIRGDHVL